MPDAIPISPRRLSILALVAMAYIVSAKLGLTLAIVHPSATPIWAPSGIALAALLILGTDVWPLVFICAFIVNLTTAGSIATSIAIGAGNTVEALAGAYLVNRVAGGRHPFDHAENVFKFTALAGLVATVLSPTIGVSALILGQFASWSSFPRIWLSWWLGDALGVIVVAPVILLWSARRRVQWDRRRLSEAAALFLFWLASCELVFGGFYPSEIQNYPLEFICLPPLLWAAFRFGPREAATGLVLLSGVAVAGTLHGFGPFVRSSREESLYLLQVYTAVASVTTLALAAMIAERRALEEQLRHLAVTDPFTGLANYRLFMDRLTAEINRSERTKRPFALLFLDVDDLKKINDRYGHLAGSRALCRVAEAMRRSCRVTDTPARYGGDEFALVLPETDGEAAWHVARRVANALSQDGETPPMTVSLGVATYPGSGTTAEEILATADRTLYDMKKAGKGRSFVM
jgi:diguanylate cyclase (GGDEF)-like protein